MIDLAFSLLVETGKFAGKVVFVVFVLAGGLGFFLGWLVFS